MESVIFRLLAETVLIAPSLRTMDGACLDRRPRTGRACGRCDWSAAATPRSDATTAARMVGLMISRFCAGRSKWLNLRSL